MICLFHPGVEVFKPLWDVACISKMFGSHLNSFNYEVMVLKVTLLSRRPICNVWKGDLKKI